MACRWSRRAHRRSSSTWQRDERMTSKTRRIQAAVWVACVGMITAAPCWAADCAQEKDKAASTMGEAVYRGVEEATKLMGNKQFGEAIEKLSKLTDEGSDFEKAVVYYNLGLAHSSKSDYAGAA